MASHVQLELAMIHEVLTQVVGTVDRVHCKKVTEAVFGALLLVGSSAFPPCSS
jgi:hypothetical protein